MWNAKLSVPVVRLNDASFSSATVLWLSDQSASKSLLVGTRLSTTFTTPPTAPLPKINVAGPRKISTCFTVAVSVDTTWSGPTRDASLASRPF